MKYRLSRQGQDLGVFTWEELRSRRQSGELRGTEWVLAEGAPDWKGIDSILETAGGMRSTPPPLPPFARKGGNRLVIWSVAILIVLFLAGATFLGIFVYRFAQRVRTVMNTGISGEGVTLASKPVNVPTNTPTEADLRKKRKAFRVRQYLEGYKQDGPVGQSWNDDALRLIESWIAQNHGEDDRTNLPSPRELSDKLVAAGCKDPLVLTVAGINSGDWNEATRRLKQAVEGFERSSYKAYPRLYATVSLATKLGNRSKRIKELDESAVELFDQAFQDGSLLPGDEAELGDIFLIGWGNSFFDRNHGAVIATVKQAGKPFEWLVLTLEGESERDQAWRARGSGYSNTVTKEGWKGFTDHLAEARKAYTKAWKLRPNLALPAVRMITVAMGQSDAGEMRLWFDRAATAQFDHPRAWADFRWGLRPRWLGSEEAVLALGVMGVNSGRFDTAVPHKLLDAIYDVESDLKLAVGEHIYERADLWPHVQKMFEGYIAAASDPARLAGWRGDYAAVAYLAGDYGVARKQLEAANWQPDYASTKHWGQDLSVMPLEVAARTGSLGQQIAEAESARKSGEGSRALQLYSQLGGATNTDERTRKFVQIQTALLEFEQRLQKGEWVDFLPTDEKDDNWALSWGKVLRVTNNVLEVQSGRNGHLLYSRANIGQAFEARGEFDVASSSGREFQAGLVMGMLDFDTRFRSSYWFAFRLKRDASEGDTAIFSKGWTQNQLSKPAKLSADRNSFQFRFENGKATASVNGVEVFREAALKNAEFSGDTFLVGVSAFGDSNDTVIRYRNLQVRRISKPSTAERK